MTGLLLRFILVLGIILTVLFLIYFHKRISGVEAESTAFTQGVALDNTIPLENTTAEKGTEQNPFVILEVVPFEGIAEIGYLIDGCEPVDIDRILTAKDPNITNLGVNGAATVNQVIDTKFELETTDVLSNWIWETAKTITKNGYYERVSDGTGDFIQQVTEWESGTVVTTTQTEPTPVPKIKNAKYIKQSHGNYKWVTIEELDPSQYVTDHNAVLIGDRVYTSRTDHYYSSLPYYTYENNNLFLKNVLKLTDDQIKDYHVIIKTIEADDLNNYPTWIDRADLISISPKSHRTTLFTLWKTYNKAGKTTTLTVNNISNLAFQDNQNLTWDTALKLFEKVVVKKDKAGLILDNKTYQTASLLTPVSRRSLVTKQFGYTSQGVVSSYDNSSIQGSSNNMYKLCLMLRSMDPLVFYNLYLNDNGGNQTPFISKTTGEYSKLSGNASLYWNKYTFMPTKVDGTKAGENDWLSGECFNMYKTNSPGNTTIESVLRKIYTYNGETKGIADILMDTTAVPKNQYTKSLFDDINVTTLNETTAANALNYILKVQIDKVNDKAAITLLDLEPCSFYNRTIHYFRTRIPNYSGVINIVTQTTASFNGKIEDLNNVYDMIYLGLNYNSDYFTIINEWPDYNKWPVYNDSDLDGKVYLHVGDRVRGSTNNNISSYPVNWLSVNTGNVCRLPGNDITALKRQDLNEFIAAGYPVLVQNILYSQDKNRIDDTSNIYKFLTENKIKSNLISEGNVYQNSVNVLEQKFTAITPSIVLLTGPTPYSGNEIDVLNNANSLYINGNIIAYRTLSFTFQISDNSPESHQKYDLELYVDKNADGKFASSERIIRKRGYSTGTYTYSKNLGESFIGAIPWKLSIVSQTNSNIRSEITGLSAIKKTAAEKQTIKILQITSDGDNGNASTLDLSTDTRFYKYTQRLNDYNVVFTKIDTDEFEELYDSNPFSITNKAGTDQLVRDYNMLIFGFSDMYSNISNSKGALDNLQYFIDAGKSVLFTHDVTSFNNKTYSGTNYDTNSANQYGYNFNRMFRGYLSMDRFGSRIGNGEIAATVARDLPTIPGGNGTLLYRETHGYTTEALKRIGSKANSDNNPIKIYPGISYSDDNNLTTKVTKLNAGQITSYPYSIDQSFICAPTHAQYFQLDLEDENVVVWYCLDADSTDSSDSSYIYAKSPNDASNNYYIYNKGNITYSGVGHSTIDNDTEAKLFVNTIIASYKSVADPPTVDVVNTDAIKESATQYYIYLDADYTETEFADDEFIDIEFVPYDSSLLSPTLNIRVQTMNGDGFIIYDEDGHQLTPDAQGYVTVNSDDKYSIRWPKSYIEVDEKRKIEVTVRNMKGGIGTTMVEIIRRNYFDLD